MIGREPVFSTWYGRRQPVSSARLFVGSRRDAAKGGVRGAARVNVCCVILYIVLTVVFKSYVLEASLVCWWAWHVCLSGTFACLSVCLFVCLSVCLFVCCLCDIMSEVCLVFQLSIRIFCLLFFRRHLWHTTKGMNNKVYPLEEKKDTATVVPTDRRGGEWQPGCQQCLKLDLLSVYSTACVCCVFCPVGVLCLRLCVWDNVFVCLLIYSQRSVVLLCTDQTFACLRRGETEWKCRSTSVGQEQVVYEEKRLDLCARGEWM